MKKPADVYSLAAVLYECFTWGEAYPKSVFKFPWQISAFVQIGKKVQKADGMSDDVYSLVSQCWCQDPSARMGCCQ